MKLVEIQEELQRLVPERFKYACVTIQISTMKIEISSFDDNCKTVVHPTVAAAIDRFRDSVGEDAIDE